MRICKNSLWLKKDAVRVCHWKASCFLTNSTDFGQKRAELVWNGKKGGGRRGASPPPPPGILAFPSIPSTQNAFPLHKTVYAFRDICYLTNSYHSWKICLKNLSFTAYILILPPTKLFHCLYIDFTACKANIAACQWAITASHNTLGAPLSMRHNLTRNINFTASNFNGTVKYLYMYFN